VCVCVCVYYIIFRNIININYAVRSTFSLRLWYMFAFETHSNEANLTMGSPPALASARARSHTIRGRPCRTGSHLFTTQYLNNTIRSIRLSLSLSLTISIYIHLCRARALGPVHMYTLLLVCFEYNSYYIYLLLRILLYMYTYRFFYSIIIIIIIIWTRAEHTVTSCLCAYIRM
jgi:hypothetical protein